MRSSTFMLDLRKRAKAYLLSFPGEFDHTHRGVLRWAGEVDLCGCGAFRVTRGRVHRDDALWIEPGTTKRVLAEARGGNRLAQRAINEEFQYACAG